jgi:hypothetical protein
LSLFQANRVCWRFFIRCSCIRAFMFIGSFSGPFPLVVLGLHAIVPVMCITTLLCASLHPLRTPCVHDLLFDWSVHPRTSLFSLAVLFSSVCVVHVLVYSEHCACTTAACALSVCVEIEGASRYRTHDLGAVGSLLVVWYYPQR